MGRKTLSRYIKKDNTVTTNPKLDIVEKHAAKVAVDVHETTRKHKTLAEISQSRWYIILTLIMAIFGACGGFPGMIQLFSLITDRPAFNFRPKEVFLSAVDSNKSRLLISGIMENDGKKPLLFQDNFSLTITLEDGTIIHPSRDELEKNMDFDLKGMKVKLTDINDLQKVTKLMPNEPITGFLVFYFEGIPKRIVSKKTTLEISNFDMESIQYAVSFPFSTAKVTTDFSAPQRGVKVKAPIDSVHR